MIGNEIRKLASGLVHNPVEISVSPRNTTAKTVEQWICPVDKKQKPALLKQLITENQWTQVLVFSRTKHGADRLARHLEKGNVQAAAIHGNKSQNQRTKALAGFKNGTIRVLVATDIAARGLDIDQLPQVVNFDLPNVPEDYVHRIGRTGRAGSTGQAISLVCADEFKELSDIERLIGNILPRKLIDGFEPLHDVPVSDLTKKVKRPKKPKPEKGQNPRNGQRSNGQKQGQQPAGGKPKLGGRSRRKPSDATRSSRQRRQGNSSNNNGNRQQAKP